MIRTICICAGHPARKWLCLILAILFVHHGFAQDVPKSTMTTIVPLGGNTFFNNYGLNGIGLSEQGIAQWSDHAVEATVFVRFRKMGSYSLVMNAKSTSPSTVGLRIGNQSKNVTIHGSEFKAYEVGKFAIADTGYVAMVLRGVGPEGGRYADIKSIEIDDKPENFQFVGDDFYWGRRGPSVHLTYSLPEQRKIQWFYNEVNIPKGMDEIGSYYMANGFREGYFGIQVNSETERRILFSVWSPYKTDDPKSIPDSAKVKLLGKGRGVYTGEFGNEGSGGQSYLKYQWQAGIAYKFLTSITPTGKGATVYTSYFFDPAIDHWILIASFLRPQTNTYYERPHSFLENFVPERGAKARKGLYGNQWACGTDGVWIELTTAKFTMDATGRKHARMDFAGGVEGDQFYLKNCGFFSSYTNPNSVFERRPTGRKPSITFTELPKE